MAAALTRSLFSPPHLPYPSLAFSAFLPVSPPSFNQKRIKFPTLSCSAISPELHQILSDFNSDSPIELAFTPPSSWYTHPELLDHEMENVFWDGWQVAGISSQIEQPHSYFTGRLGRMSYIVCRDEHGELHAFHNVCRHHASILATGSGCKMKLECPYHGWTYSMDGKLQKATHLSGIKNFRATENGLFPIAVGIWGPFVLLNFSKQNDHLKVDQESLGQEWLGDAFTILNSVDTCLRHVAHREYTINCNWKVFCDNYLDGGYHVPFAHKSLSDGLNLDGYTTQGLYYSFCSDAIAFPISCGYHGYRSLTNDIFVRFGHRGLYIVHPMVIALVLLISSSGFYVLERVSIQSCKTNDASQRLGESALYAFVYPNFMINRYGPWMDTNLVIPISTSECRVVFEYFLDPSFMDDEQFIERSLCESDIVQREDISLCEGVQLGLESPAFDRGRYAPSMEFAMHHFHCLLKRDLFLRHDF